MRLKMSSLVTQKGYKPILDLRETDRAIKYTKDIFQLKLAKALNLERISAPLFVEAGTGVNDDLSGVERKATFEIKDSVIQAETLFSLAKWKRMKLAEYGFKVGEGLYTDMNAIRPDEESLDSLHSVYVDQWDWEKVISKDDRTLDFLKETVRQVYQAIKKTGEEIQKKYPQLKYDFPDDITFIHTEDLLAEYPDLTPLERESRASKEYGAIFVIGIGAELKDGTIHDDRAPDYDDWITPTKDGKMGLNGDIIVYNTLLERAFELSSMGIRVDKDSLTQQCKIRGCEERLKQDWHKQLIAGEYPLSIGGGIGQSRLCMYLLQKAHIGEVQSSIWPDEMKQKCQEVGIRLL